MKKTDQKQAPAPAKKAGYKHAAGDDWHKLEALYSIKESQAEKLANEYLKSLDL